MPGAKYILNMDNGGVDVSSNLEGKPGRNSPSLALNKVFAQNIVKQIGDHNRIISDKGIIEHRKFENRERKKHTVKNLKPFSPLKTMYCDYVASEEKEMGKGKRKRKFITPFEQVQKLVTDAAEFDQTMANQKREEEDELKNSASSRTKNRITLDKTLLNNHLRHSTVHNRLKEEDEMWDQYKLQKNRKVISLKSRSASTDERNAKYGGSMYCDRESKKTKPQRITATSNETSAPHFGKWTKKLLEEEGKDPDRWSHDGFQDIYKADLETVGRIKKKKNKKITSRKVIVSSEESISEESEPVNLKRRIVKRSGPHDKRTKLSEGKIISPKSIILNTLNGGNKGMKKRDEMKVIRKHHGLHADDFEETVRKRSVVTRTVEKWGHDGFDEFNQSEDTDNSPKKRVKSLAVVIKANDTPSGTITLDDSEWTEQVTENDAGTTKKATSFVENSREKNVWRRLHNNDELTVTRVSLKNSIHGEAQKKSDRLVLPEKSTSKKVKPQYVTSSEEESRNSKKSRTKVKRLVKRNNRKYSSSSEEESESSSNESDSSFTESSTDERHRKIKRKREKKKLKRSAKHKHTFSDYDSDFKPRQ